MLERVVHQVLLGYLGRYVKDFSRDQVKVTLWNIEVELKDIDLILEAFDYLQLPFALKQGRVGRLSIKVPWSLIGGEPILIALENVFFSVSPRDDHEWRMDAIETRELAGKKAKLAAAELAKLSRRVCDNKGGWSFIPFVTTKVLENIQVSIRNFHVFYSDLQSNSEQVSFGLRFSSLTMLKQNSVGLRMGQVSKVVEVEGLEIYCSICKDAAKDLSLSNTGGSESWFNSHRVGDKSEHIVEPFNVSLSLLVNRSEKLNDLLQYSISAKMTCLVVSLNEIQLQQILVLSDYLSTSQLREKYGRYRPWSSPLSRKEDGWQRLWWHYAQESILSDVREKLKKTSWRYLGQRLSNRRKYVNLYKTKLELLRQDQPIDESLIRDLEQMEKESDIDDILSYRTAAEHELQEVLLKSSTANFSVEKSRLDGQSSGKSRGWLNWLSRGMLGAGGTDDSSQFSGVVSDEDVQDIYEATKFYPPVLSGIDADTNDKIYSRAIEFSIDEISATIWSMNLCQDIARLNLHGAVMKCNLQEELVNVIAFVKSGEMVNAGNEQVIRLMSCIEKNVGEDLPSYRVQVDLYQTRDVELSVKVMLQSLEVAYETTFFWDLIEFFSVIKYFEFQHERVLSSLNGIEDVKSRLLAKAQCILSSHEKVAWDVNISNITINFPSGNAVSEEFNMVLDLGSLVFASKTELSSSIDGQSFIQKSLVHSASISDWLTGFQLQDLYNHFEVNLVDFEVKLVKTNYPHTISIVKKFCASIAFASCIIPDESRLKQLEVYVSVPSLDANFSLSIYESVVALIVLLNAQCSRSEPVVLRNPDSLHSASSHLGDRPFGLTLTASINSAKLLLDLANDGEHSSSIMLALKTLDVWYSLIEYETCRVSLKAIEVTAHTNGEKNNHVLCSFGDLYPSNTANQDGMANTLGDASDPFDENKTAEACFVLYYEAIASIDFTRHKFTLYLNDADLHCYPYIIGLLVGFYDRICSSTAFIGVENAVGPTFQDKSTKNMAGFQFRGFDFSNYSGIGSSDYASLSLDCFPFITMHNSGSVGSLGSSLRFSVPDWRKSFSLRDNKLRSPSCSSEKGFNPFHSSPLKSKVGTVAFPVSGSSPEASLYAIDINLSGVKLHFHDSSCIVGTITLPTSKSSVSICDDCMDLVSSSEGVILTSSWWTSNFHDFLWGPSLPNLSPILNICMKKRNFGSLSSQLEFSVGIQHTCWVLPFHYIAIIIGYFSLDDWSSNPSMQSTSKSIEHMENQSEIAIICKFEVLESSLIFPIESDDHRFLKTDIQQLYGSFTNHCVLSDVLKDIPPECVVPENKVARPNNCLNIFGRDLSLSLLLFKDDCITFIPGPKPRNFPLVAPFSADFWIRIPSELESLSEKSSDYTCIMSRVGVCQVYVDDFYFIGGFEVLLEIIDRFSIVHDESKSYTSDVLQFLQSRRLQKENKEVSVIDSSITLIEVRCYVESLLIQLNRLGKDLLEPVSKAEMSFICSMSLINETHMNLDLSFYSLELLSLPNLVILARCSDACSTSSVFDLSFSKSDPCQNEFSICLPSLNIWLHCSDWTDILDLFDSYGKKLTTTAKLDSLPGSSAMSVPEHVPQISDKMSAPTYVPLSTMQETVVVLRSENIGIMVFFPMHVAGEEFTELVFAEKGSKNVSSTGTEGKLCKLLTFMTHSKSSELIISGKNAKFKCILEKTSGAVGFQGDDNVNYWPLFQIFQVNVETEICNIEEKPVHVNLEIQCDQLDVWLSHQIFFFLHDVRFDVPGSRSQYDFGSVEFQIQLRKGSLMVSDGRWSCSGPLLEVLLKNFLLRANFTGNSMNGAVACDLQVNYNNVHKVFWEPFLEPWKFEMEIIRKQNLNALLDNSNITDVHLISTGQLNFNFTEPLIETVLRTIEMVKDAWGFLEHDSSEKQRFLDPQLTENMSGGRYAPYILQNLTSSPLEYHVYQGLASSDQFDASKEKDGKIVQAGASVPIYLNDIPEEQLYHYRPSHSSDNLSERQSNGVAHHLMTIQLDGMSVPSAPVSMDLVGLTYFEVDFSNNSQYNVNLKENGATDGKNGFVVPVVFDVSVQRYSKLIRLYSTVIILNATSIPLELRFDIPFGISPKILDPVYPGQEFPLPLHLAEAGRMRWRPLGNSYLWSEAHNLSDLLSLEGKIGFLRSFVCYPSHPSSDPFRCCLSLRHISIPAADRLKKGSGSCNDDTVSQSIQSSSKNIKDLCKSKDRYIHQMTLSTPLVINNYLPEAISLTIESGGITRTALLSKIINFFHHIDLSHDLTLEFNIYGYRPSVLKFPRTETFSKTAKFSETKFSQSETVAFEPDTCSGPIYVTMEKMMDAFSGARELFIYVPFLLYNCTPFPLSISESANEMDRTVCTLPSCYDQVDNELFQGTRDGLSLLFSNQHSAIESPQIESLGLSFSKDRIVSTRKTFDLQLGRFVRNPLISLSQKQTDQHDSVDKKNSSNNLKNRLGSSTRLSGNNDFMEKECGMVKACIYSPHPISSGSEIMVCVANSSRGHNSENVPSSPWSGPFLLVPPSGSTTVLVPQPLSNAMFILSVTSNAIPGAFAGRTRAITFQPRYVISNACSKELYYKQKGTDIIYHLGVGQHSQLHWTDTTRELLMSLRFDEPGWQWSGSFLPDHLGDTQVKIRNYASGTMNMIRVEVQNADVSIRNEKIVGSLQGNCGTNLILISEDDTGYMPYRIDNFSKERLRIYQQRCESLDTIVHPYTSCPYAWDEPCYPHRVSIEVPGERMVGSFALDDLKEHMPVHLQSTSEKPERMLLLSVRAEGATKVLTIIDSTYHVLKDMTDQSSIRFQEKQNQEKQGKPAEYKEKFSVTIPCIGISLVNSYPQELLFASAKNIKIDLFQSVDHQKLSCHISSLQIDNQLHNTPYPVVLSFNREYRSNQAGQIKKDDSPKFKAERGLLISSDSSFEPVFNLAVAKWRKKDISLVSFEYISLRMADFCLELEQELILSLLYFYKAVSPGLQSQALPFSDPNFNVGFMHGQTSEHVKVREHLHGSGTPVLSRIDDTGGLPLIVPIGAPWQQIHCLARRQKKIYVESFDLAPIKFTLSFSSSPWMLRSGVLTSGESVIHRGLMALADVEGARIHLKELSIMHQMASWESIQEILIRHYTRQFLHEMYKVFGSAGVIGNPMGFARSLGVGIRDFLAVPAKSILKSPTGLITGMAQGTTSLLSNTVYALSDAATQFSKAAHKGIVAFTFDEQAVARMERQLKGEASHSKGIINEVFEGLTGLLQSPVKEAEKHGLPGILSGIALGVTGLVGRPAASILEVTGKTAQSIRNRSRLYQMGSQRCRVRLPRPLSRELPLRPYSWEEAVGISVLKEADDGKLKDEVYVMSKALKNPGKYVIMTERLVLVVNCPSLVDLGKPEFRGVAANQEWVIETEISLHSVIHTDADDGVVHIVGSSLDALLRQNQQMSRKGGGGGTKMRWNNPSTPLPLFQTNLELESEEDTKNFLRVLLSTIEQGKEQGGSEYLLQRSSIR
ncbi:hypothetical protein ERO13_A05G394600v2 [Gossypium hirsutum]|uniref:Uncharacterized protein isoform X2 n=1 Tax=Gossypium hirsutum TaxID=3635 RepID=A0A1U8LHZ7_GOSHI|nr:uncharacterized protein LOC107927572 isoform X2 [Gossypium hirsutum]KAG4203337.1 hypothetical protein ERO13_A05G394600v2 [Gossypium hirsutum]